jgi:type II secretory pathway pseudopilin PulG
MAKRTFHGKRKRGEPGIILLEAVVAAAFASTILAVITPLFMRQIELARNARDLDLIEAAVNEDINAVRHYARFWRLSSGPYSPAVFSAFGLGSSSSMIYDGTGICDAWSSKGKLEFAFSSDLNSSNYATKMPGGIAVDQTSALANDVVPGYRIARTVSYPISTLELTPAQATNHNQTTIRLRYAVRKRVGTTNVFVSMPFSFERTADIQIPAQFSC